MSKGAVQIGPLLSFSLQEVTFNHTAMTDTDSGPATALQRRLDDLRSSAVAALDEANDAGAPEQWRIVNLGRKSALSDVLGGMGKLSAEERRLVGSTANLVKRELEQAFTERESVIRQRELEATL